MKRAGTGCLVCKAHKSHAQLAAIGEPLPDPESLILVNVLAIQNVGIATAAAGLCKQHGNALTGALAFLAATSPTLRADHG